MADIDNFLIEDNNNEEDFLVEGDSDEDDFVVTIGEVKSSSFLNKSQNASTSAVTSGGTASKLELDGTPSYKSTQIYDLDLASMEDKPWRKPGADITDYFNYGFNEG